MTYTAAKNDSMLRNRGAANENTTLNEDGLAVMAHRAGQQVSSILSSAYTQTSQTAEAVVKEIRHRPVQSSIIALGIGYVLAAIFRR